MGLYGDKSSTRVADAVGEAIARIAAAGRTPGILASSPAEAAGYVQQGVRYVAFNGEALAQAGAREALRATKAGLDA